MTDQEFRERAEREIMETPEEIHEAIFNPKPVVVQCPCGNTLSMCLCVIAARSCNAAGDPEFNKFIRCVPEWYLRDLAAMS